MRSRAGPANGILPLAALLAALSVAAPASAPEAGAVAPPDVTSHTPPDAGQPSRSTRAPSDLPPGPGADLVAAHCGACHSLALVTQNRGDAAHWTELIRWMQAKHNLWDLGPAETEIVAYLAQHYGADTRSTRRAPLDTRWRVPED